MHYNHLVYSMCYWLVESNIWQCPLTSICKISKGSFQWRCEDKDITNGGIEARLSTKEGEREIGIQR